ncbi:hypothetical protein BSNK01_12530 [Bacillaceae bacterium]
MSLGTVLQEAREEKGIAQEQLAFELNLSRQMISHVENGRRKLPKDVAPKSARILDCGFYIIELAHYFTGGAFAKKLNGDRVDLHRGIVTMKTLEELREAHDAIEKADVTDHPSAVTKEQRERIEHAAIQALDAVVALLHYVAVMCRDYKFSWFGLWMKWRKKARERGYLKE